MTDRHILIVPDSIDEPMELEHPVSCPQHGQPDPVRDQMDNSFACLFEQEAWCEGLETFFRTSREPDPFYLKAVYVAPGRHVIERWDEKTGDDWDGGLRLVEGGAD